MLESMKTIAKKFAPPAAISKEHQAIMAAGAALDRQIADKKVELQEAGQSAPHEVGRIAKELNVLETHRVVNAKSAAALADGLESSKAAERTAARAKERSELVKENEIAKANIAKYQQLAAQIVPLMENLEKTERRVFEYNLSLENGEEAIVSAEAALKRYPLAPLHQSVALPAIDPTAEPFRKALDHQELQAEAIGREAMRRIATRRRVA
jgi:hypothetical protein